MTITLAINSVEQNLAEARLSLDSLHVSWSGPRSFHFVEHVSHSDASFEVEDRVVLSVDGAVRFRGRIKRIELEGVPNTERVVYVCLGLRELAKEVTAHDPTYGFPRVVFNAPKDDDDYDAGRSGKSVGEIIAWLFDQHAAELRDAEVIAAAPATGYVQNELDQLGVVPPKVVFDSQDFDSVLDELIAFQRGHRFIADPDTQTFHFQKVADLPPKTVTYNSPDKPLSALLKPSTEGRATAVKIYGPRRPINKTLKLSEGGLTKLWETDYESDWTWPKCFDPDNDDTYGRVFRRFQVADGSKRRIAHSLAEANGLGDNSKALCPQVYRKTTDDTWTWVPSVFDFKNGIILLAQPATVGDQYKEGDPECAADICLVYAYLGSGLTARAPLAGHEGTAYTEPENPVEVLRRFYAEDFVLSSQTSKYQNIARKLLRAYKDIVYAGTVRLGHLDWSLAGLANLLNFAGQDDEGSPVTTGFEALGAMLQAVTYDFPRGRTELVLSTDASEFAGVSLRVAARLRELETQARRGERYRALHRCTQAPTPRAGNDGEIGAAENARGVYSLRRYEDSEGGRVAGHVDIESGEGITITRQADANHNGFKIAAKQPGEWYWFHAQLSSAGMTLEMYARQEATGGLAIKWYPVLAGKVTKVIAYAPGTISAGAVTVKVSRKTKGEGETCPDTRTDYDDPAAVVSADTNIAHAAAAPGITFGDDDILGLRAITGGNFVPGGSPFDLIAGVYLEAD